MHEKGENMQEVFEKIIDQLKAESIIVDDDAGNRAVEIIKQVADEYNNGWFPCSEPPKVFREENRELIPFLVCDEESQYPYRAFYDGKNWGDGFSKLNPSVWQYLPPKPYQPKGE